MTDNNLEEEFENLIKEVYPEEVFGSVDENLIPKDAVMAATMRAMAKSIGYIVAPVFEDLLTKKDQEHKAELEMIAKKMKKKSRIHTTVGRDEDYEITVINLRDALSILDSHINKLSN